MTSAQPRSLKIEAVETTRYGALPRPLKIAFLVFTVCGVLLAVYHVFNFHVANYVMLDSAYFFLLFALFEAPAFLLLPARKEDRKRIPWYDMLFAALGFVIPIFYFVNSWQIDRVGWVPPKETMQLVTAAIYVLLLLESGRRMGGVGFLVVCVVIGIYPMVAEYMPWLFWGKSFSVPWAVAMFVYSPSGILGLPGQIMGNLLLGFLLFAAVLQASGAGDFFLNLAAGLLGRYRGGPAKVSVLASGFFGMLSGSAIANVVSTGCFTIPTMKRIGYPGYYAGAVEACASTGGMLMPPVMGTVAFVMAAFLGIPYFTVCLAAAIPALLYYFGLMVAVDGYAARTGLGGLPR